ncbi:uncharacterized protein LOC114535489 [Dendronephthya gigantea]|uniref:uncharacterized protein LOC114535489 n=1 Tax=Dendronephthya gigantea TaxID=151771 RepID=UPI00106B18EC|nr:uncharacterized protein LOC114535489 [Dendronephthya gigantea]
MADETRKRIEAARLMREAAKLLEESNKDSAQQTERTTSEELSKLFAPYRREATSNRQTVQEAKPPKPKRQRCSWVPMFNPLPTWTHRFCLLSDKNANIAPNITEKEKLKAMGLGKNGYSIPYLRDESPLRQAVAYVRPLQKSIDTINTCEVEANEAISGANDTDGPTVPCLKCNMQIKIDEESMLTHQRFHIEEEEQETQNLSDNKIDGDEEKIIDHTGDDTLTQEINRMQEMFPNAQRQTLLETLRANDYSTEDAVSDLLGLTDDTCKSSTASSIDGQLAAYAKNVDKDNIKILHVERECLWERALIFYKCTERKDLYRHLSIVFEGYEDAIDGGGLRIEFFGDLIRCMSNRLFEGEDGHLVPRHSWDNVNLLRMGGLMLAHSILQQGPGMPSLANYIYDFLVYGNKEKSVSAIKLDDLPNTPQNSDLTEFLKKIEDCTDDEELSNLLDEPRFSSIVDRSGWPVGRVLSIKSRVDFISQILIEELYDKRLPSLISFKEGLDHFGLIKFIQMSPDTWKPFFVANDGSQEISLTAKKFLSLVQSDPKSDEEKITYSYFGDFLEKHENTSECIPALGGNFPVLCILLKYCTSNLRVPPLGLTTSIKLLYGNKNLTMPDSDTCFNILKLPVIYNDYGAFEKVMLASLRHASCSFSASR